MKVWGGNSVGFYGHPYATCHGQARLVVRARSKAAVQRALKAAGLRTSIYHLRGWWCETENADELAITQGTEGVVFITNWLNGGPFKAERIGEAK